MAEPAVSVTVAGTFKYELLTRLRTSKAMAEVAASAIPAGTPCMKLARDEPFGHRLAFMLKCTSSIPAGPKEPVPAHSLLLYLIRGPALLGRGCQVRVFLGKLVRLLAALLAFLAMGLDVRIQADLYHCGIGAGTMARLAFTEAEHPLVRRPRWVTASARFPSPAAPPTHSLLPLLCPITLRLPTIAVTDCTLHLTSTIFIFFITDHSHASLLYPPCRYIRTMCRSRLYTVWGNRGLNSSSRSSSSCRAKRAPGCKRRANFCLRRRG
mmetsp:Transcript_12881/g.35097  ORF Transcript_12881/g.35097 Transcript_12881/m.35097 type:complete len:267 (-) Transcript_12881:71-871(-)